MRTANGRNQKMPKNFQETTKKWPRQMTEKWPSKYVELQTATKISQYIHQLNQHWINIESTLNQHWINIESTLNQHWINIESTLNQHWINIESTLNQHWIDIESTLNRHWIDIESTLNRHWIDIESTLNRHWIDIESTLNRHWIDIESTLNRHWIDIESTLNRHWIDIESTLNRHWIDIESTLNQHWINIESTLNQHFWKFQHVSTCVNPEFASSRLNALRSAFDSSSWHECVNPAKAIACTKKTLKTWRKNLTPLYEKSYEMIWNVALFDDYLMFIWCLFVYLCHRIIEWCKICQHLSQFASLACSCVMSEVCACCDCVRRCSCAF